ncbi:MAG: hypothetical protein ABIS50_24310 [Luteolibacter sp.]|uniref:hypothetical protein n=1 Tax=Luteolibacter sp. TaxID=1962973 RepID=UPI00326338EE
MSTQTPQYSARKKRRLELFQAITSTLIAGHSMNTLKSISGMSVSKVSHAVGVSREQGEQWMNLNDMFVKRFGSKELAKWDDTESVTLKPSLLVDFLSQPAITSLVAEILAISATNIQRCIART